MDIGGWIDVLLKKIFSSKSMDASKRNFEGVDNSTNTDNSQKNTYFSLFQQFNIPPEDFKRLQEGVGEIQKQMGEMQEQTNETFAGVKTLLEGKQSQKNRVQDGSASEVKYIFDRDSFALVILSRIDWTNPDVSVALNNEGLKSEVVVRHINQAKENWLNEARNFWERLMSIEKV